MLPRFTYALGVALLTIGFSAPQAVFAQTVRFETSVGEFDMVLNPARDPRLQEHTDNLLAYVDSLRYHCTWINRADSGFVLQMGSFISRTLRPPGSEDEVISIETFDPVNGVPAAETGLTNSRGTVSLALPGDGLGGTNRDAGTSSFFVNLDDNSALDPDFTVFAVVPDLTTIDTIMSLDTTDLTDDFGIPPGNLAFSDVPLLDNGNMVFIQRAFVLQDNLAAAAATNAALDIIAGGTPVSSASSLLDPTPATMLTPLTLPSTAAASTSAAQNSTPSTLSAAASASAAVPEPTALTLIALAALACLGGTRRLGGARRSLSSR